MFKKPIIGWLAAIGIAAAAGLSGLPAKDVKEIVCAQPVIEAQKPVAPILPEPVK